jgi:hypothetical protein
VAGATSRPSALGYGPRYNFPEFFEALERGDRSHYPYADLPWWGSSEPACSLDLHVSVSYVWSVPSSFES